MEIRAVVHAAKLSSVTTMATCRMNAHAAVRRLITAFTTIPNRSTHPEKGTETMSMKKPAKCVTPKRDREQYSLNARDLRNLLALVKEANDILSYYINMPENTTGVLVTKRVDELEDLSEQIEDLKNTIYEIEWWD